MRLEEFVQEIKNTVTTAINAELIYEDDFYDNITGLTYVARLVFACNRKVAIEKICIAILDLYKKLDIEYKEHRLTNTCVLSVSNYCRYLIDVVLAKHKDTLMAAILVGTKTGSSC